MAKDKTKAGEVVTESVAQVSAAAETPVAPPVVGDTAVTPAAPVAPVEPELKEFDCDMPADGRPPAVSMARTVKARDAYDAVGVYFKTLGIIETPYRPIVREKVAGK